MSGIGSDALIFCFLKLQNGGQVVCLSFFINTLYIIMKYNFLFSGRAAKNTAKGLVALSASLFAGCGNGEIVNRMAEDIDTSFSGGEVMYNDIFKNKVEIYNKDNEGHKIIARNQTLQVFIPIHGLFTGPTANEISFPGLEEALGEVFTSEKYLGCFARPLYPAARGMATAKDTVDEQATMISNEIIDKLFEYPDLGFKEVHYNFVGTSLGSPIAARVFKYFKNLGLNCSFISINGGLSGCELAKLVYAIPFLGPNLYTSLIPNSIKSIANKEKAEVWLAEDSGFDSTNCLLVGSHSKDVKPVFEMFMEGSSQIASNFLKPNDLWDGCFTIENQIPKSLVDKGVKALIFENTNHIEYIPSMCGNTEEAKVKACKLHKSIVDEFLKWKKISLGGVTTDFFGQEGNEHSGEYNVNLMKLFTSIDPSTGQPDPRHIIGLCQLI